MTLKEKRKDIGGKKTPGQPYLREKSRKRKKEGRERSSLRREKPTLFS